MSMFPQSGLNTLDYGHAETGERSRLVTRFFNQVYLWMAFAMAWSAVVSAAIAYTPALRPLISPGVSLVACLIAFGISWATRSAVMRLGLGAGIGLFVLYATIIGVMIAPIWIIYNQGTIGAAFLLTGGLFFVMSLIGFITKIDLSKIGAIALMIAFGLILASVVNFFVASNMISWIVTYGIVIVFPIIIAWQTQDLKEFALANGDNGDMASRVALLGALTLYIAFINIFLSILRLLSNRD